MTIERRTVLQGLAGAALAVQAPGMAHAQTRAETLRYVTGNTINTLDLTMPGSTRESFGLCMNVYDRLFSYGRKKLGGNWVFDATANIRGELAKAYSHERGQQGDHHHPAARLRMWHDGTPVTAEDVKWSLDRAVLSKSLAVAAVADRLHHQRRPVQDRRSPTR